MLVCSMYTSYNVVLVIIVFETEKVAPNHNSSKRWWNLNLYAAVSGHFTFPCHICHEISLLEGYPTPEVTNLQFAPTAW